VESNDVVIGGTGAGNGDAAGSGSGGSGAVSGGTGGAAGSGLLGDVVIKAVGWAGVVDATDGGGGKRASIVASIPSMVVTEA